MGKSSSKKEEAMLQERLEELREEIKQHESDIEAVNEWQANKAELEQQLDNLRYSVDQYGQAEEIISQKEEILAEAQTKKEKLEKDNESLDESLSSKKADLETLTELIGSYSTAEEVISAGQKEADRIKEEAENKAKEIIEAANAQKKTAFEDKESILEEARKSADSITKEAKDTIEQIYSCKEAEGESRKNQIIQSAEEESKHIIDAATKDAETIAESITKAANEYSDKKRASAENEAEQIRKRSEQEAENIISSAQKRANSIIEKKEQELDKAREEADRIKDKATNEAEAIKEAAKQSVKEIQDSICAAKNDIALREENLNNMIKQTKRTEEVLKQREKNLDQEIDERVESVCEYNANRFARLEETLSLYQKDNKRLNEAMQKRDVEKAVIADKNELVKLRELVNLFGQKGITEDNLDEYISASLDLERANQKIYELKEELNKKNQVLRDSNDQSEELDHLKDKNKYYMEMVRALEEELEKNQSVSRDDMLAPVRLIPSFMSSKSLQDDRDIANEQEWLDIIYEKIGSKSEHSDLKFSRRQIYAYHTAQKIRDMSPLVILAGVSGTGKSELPKNYAIYGGMNFLSIPVKPDWDSPASLFGYYNSIERRFEATELIRALYQMSMDDIYKKQMMMVLLDEMNLAHPEQYFADMLSKLESCRGMTDIAQYDILLGGGERPEHLNIGQNVLWTGTMNEDETTKGLSDKVIDRSTLITFPRPKELFNRENRKEIKQEFILSRDKWTTWISKADTSDELKDKLEEYRGVVQSINESMANMGRNLGHRVWQSMSQYISHYPDVIYAKNKDARESAIEKAFADAIAFKVMPKLRGVEVRGQNEQNLEQIGALLAQYADELVPDFNNARQLTTELFQWCSADFMNKDDEYEQK